MLPREPVHLPLDVTRVLVGAIVSVEVRIEVQWPGLEDSVGMRKEAEHVNHLSRKAWLQGEESVGGNWVGTEGW